MAVVRGVGLLFAFLYFSDSSCELREPRASGMRGGKFFG